ncbi:MAG: DNA polymerase IV [Sciscionella sp.]|nr:DNA polymerase IV [Sciscionella sp.]
MGRSGDLPRGLLTEYRVVDGSRPDDDGCPILHVDMDAFYASVEIRNRPELADRPVIVAGGSTRGVVMSANYPAREYGVRSAMPAMRAKKLCPAAVFLPPSFTEYQRVSKGVMGLFREVSPLVEPISMDEAFIDVGGALRRLRMSPAQIGRHIADGVHAEFGITCSVGVGPSKFIAKLASGMAKPDGMVVVPKDRVLDFLHPLPVSALWGVGARTADRLRAVGLTTVGEIAGMPIERLRRLVGVATAAHLSRLAAGHDDRAVVPERVEKSIGAEETFEIDRHDRVWVKRELLHLAERTASSLRTKGLRGRVVSIKVRFTDFRTITRSKTVGMPTNGSQEIYRTACQLLDEQTPPGAIRLIGVRVEQLRSDSDTGEQLVIDEPEYGWRDADHAIDRARSRFGYSAVRPASLLDREVRGTIVGPQSASGSNAVEVGKDGEGGEFHGRSPGDG